MHEGQTILVVTHENDVARHAGRLLRMRDGEIISDTARDGDAPIELRASS